MGKIFSAQSSSHTTKNLPLRTKNWKLPDFLLLLMALVCIPIGIVLFANNLNAGRLEYFAASDFKSGEWRGTTPLYSYFPDSMSLSFEKELNRQHLHVEAKAQEDVWQGFGFQNEFSIPPDATMHIHWRNANSKDAFVSVFLSDGSVNSKGTGQPESFMYYLRLPSREWSNTVIPLSQFVRNTWQPAGASEDGTLDTRGMKKLEFGFGPDESISLDIDEIEFTWETSYASNSFIIPLFIFLINLLILFLRKSPPISKSLNRIQESRYALFLSEFLTLVLISTNSNILALELIGMGFLVYPALVVLADEFLNWEVQRRLFWPFRMIPLCILYAISNHSANIYADLLFFPIISIPFIFSESNWGLITSLGLSAVSILLSYYLSKLEIPASIIILVLTLSILFYCLRIILLNQNKQRYLQTQSQLFKNLVSLSHDAIFILDESKRILHMNRAAQKFLGISEKEAYEVYFTDLVKNPENWQASFDEAEKNHDPVHLWLRFPENRTKSQEHEALIQKFAAPKLAPRYTLIIRDMSQVRDLEDNLRDANARLSAFAFVDGLTNVSSRRAFDQALEVEWKRNRRTNTPISILLISLDKFREFNEALGHNKGDEALIAVASCIKYFARRPEDLCARFSGEVFAMLFPGMNNTFLEDLAQSIRQAVSNMRLPTHIAGEYLTVSIGAACSISRNSERTPSGLLHAADVALYRAQRSGMNRVVMAVSNDYSVETEFKLGLDENNKV